MDKTMLNLLSDPKKAATLIISEGKKPSMDFEKGDDYKEESGDEFEMGLKQSAKVLIEAIGKGDADMVAKEFKNMMQLCQMSYDSEMEDD